MHDNERKNIKEKMFVFFAISVIIVDDKTLKIHIDRPIINMIMYTHWSSLGTLGHQSEDACAGGIGIQSRFFNFAGVLKHVKEEMTIERTLASSRGSCKNGYHTHYSDCSFLTLYRSKK